MPLPLKFTQCEYRKAAGIASTGLCHTRSVGHSVIQPGWDNITLLPEDVAAIIPRWKRDKRLNKPFLQIFWGISGQGRFRTMDGEEFLLRPGDYFCYLPGDDHLYSNSFADDWEFRFVTFSGGTGELIRIFNLKREIRHGGMPEPERFELLRSLLLRPDGDAAREADLLGYELLFRTVNPPPPAPPTTAQAFLKLIEQHADDAGFDIAAGADALGLSPLLLNRRFKKETGTTPGAALLKFRLDRAATLLRGGVAVKLVAAECGFASPNYLAKAFRRRFGVAPRQYRASTHLA